MVTLTTLFISSSDYDVTIQPPDLSPPPPAPPENLTLSLILATAVTLKWSVSCQDIREFYIYVEPLQQDSWQRDNATFLDSFEVTGIAGWRRSYTVTELEPDIRYTMHMVTVSAHGVSNASNVIYFSTMTGE